MNPSDRDITQQIRKSIVADKSLFTYAHNVKVITQNGMVTLKGRCARKRRKHRRQGCPGGWCRKGNERN